MALNLADDLGIAAAIAPLASPVGVVPFWRSINETGHAGFALEWVLWPILIGYVYMAVIVVPTLVVTRKFVVWTPIKLMSFGAILAILPLVLSFLWAFVASVAVGRGAGFFEELLSRDFTLLGMLMACGVATAAAFVIAQRIIHRDAV